MSLSKKETEFLTTLSEAGKQVFTFQQAADHWPSQAAAANALTRLVRKGWLQRLERGLYMIIPLEAGPDRIWSENAFVIASHLITPGAVAYWSALRLWNMTEQIPTVQFIQTTRQKKQVTIQGTTFRFIAVTEQHYFGITTRSMEGKQIPVTDREKTLIDAASRPDLSGGIYQLIQAMSVSVESVDWDQLDQYLKQWGGGVVAKRLGYLLETLALPIPDRDPRVNRWQRMISKGISPLEPGAGKSGPINTRWRLQVNVPVEMVKTTNRSGQ